MSHVFDDYAPVKPDMPGRHNGVLVSQEQGEAVAYALWNLEDRGRMFVSPNDKIYEGMIIGIHSRDNDLVVNPLKGKKLTNVRASGTDEAVRLTTPIKLTLEGAVEFIDDAELVEITPQSIRLRKRYLSELERRRHFKKWDGLKPLKGSLKTDRTVFRLLFLFSGCRWAEIERGSLKRYSRSTQSYTRR